MIHNCALLTISYNEQLIFPRWFAYYAQWFMPRDIYVLDHQSSDNHLHGLGVNVQVIGNPDDIPGQPRMLRPHWLLDQVKQAYRALQKFYGYVLFAETDEFLVANPDRFDGLASLVDAVAMRGAPYLRATGFELRPRDGDVGSERPATLDLDVSLLDYCTHWHRSTGYDKTLLANGPMDWKHGFHETEGNTEERSDDAFLIHTPYADLGLRRQRMAERMSANWQAYHPDSQWVFEYLKEKAPLAEPIPDNMRDVHL